MNKTFVKLALASSLAAMSATSAFAADGVSVHGKFHMSVDSVEADNGVMVQDEDKALKGNQSRIGFKATEDLGNGLNLSAVYDLNANILTSNGAPTTRNAFVAVKSGFGTVSAGRMNGENGSVSPIYNQANGVAYSVTDNEGVLSAIGQRETVTALGYANKISGFDVEARYALRGIDELGNAANNNVRTLEVAADYQLGRLTLGAGLLNEGRDGVALVDGSVDSTVQLVAAYDLGMAKVSGAFRSNKLNVVAGQDDNTRDYLLSTAVPLNDRVTLVGAFGKTELSGTTDVNTAKLEAAYALSKRTSVYGGLSMQTEDTAGVETDKDTLTMGLIHKF